MEMKKWQFAATGGAKHDLLATVAAAAFCAMVPARPAMAQDMPAAADAPADPAQEQQDAIVVTGIRASLERSADIKRQSSQVVDAISAEDLGKLPDTNIAEGLQRITGVQIQRTGGEGNGFQIRGATQNLTLVNGREVAPDADTGAAPAAVRQVNLFNYPSELFSEVLVYKSPAASQIEGGIGGTVDLRMPDPLTAKERTVLAGDVGRLSLSGKTAWRGTFLTSKRFLNDTLGVVLGATLFNRRTTNDTYAGGSYYATSALDVTGDGVADANVALPYNMAYTRTANVRNRLTLNALVAWEPSDAFRAYIDASYVSQSNDRERTFIGFNFSAAKALATPTALTTQKEADGSITVLAGAFRNVTVASDGLNQSDDRKIRDGAVGAVWKPFDHFTVSGEVSRSTSSVRQFANTLSISQAGTTSSLDLRTTVPSVAIVAGGDVADPAAYKASVVNVRDVRNAPESTQGRLDLTYAFDGEGLTKISVGGRITDQSFDNVTLNNRFQNSFPIGNTPPLTQFPQYIALGTVDDFLGGAAGNYPTHFVWTEIPGTPEAGTALLAAFGDNRPLQPLPDSSFKVIEKTKAAYLQLDFEGTVLGMPFGGNVGVRYVNTRLRSLGSAVTTTGTVVPLDYRNAYDDWLPSLNTKLEISHDLIARFTASKVMARPPIQSLSAGTNIQFASGLNQAQSGQPFLDPYRATQGDVSLEYYFGKGGIVSAAFFYKDIKSFITQTSITGATFPAFPGQTFFLTLPSNGPGGVSKGFEVGVQRSLGFIAHALEGFGVIGNYTYVDSKRNGSSLPIENTSKNSFNVIGYFESGPFQTRIAYNWRDKQYLGLQRAANVYYSARGQLDFSMTYDILDNLTLSLEGSDLLESPQTGYAEFESRSNAYEVSDRRILAGVRLRL
jgi:iron complex outermembrane receptor protein